MVASRDDTTMTETEMRLVAQGERTSLSFSSWRLGQELLARYLFACGFCRESRALDLGCGLGYGTILLEMFGEPKLVLGVDIDAEAIRFACERWLQLSHRAQFSPIDVLEVRGTFDVITAFEIIEHLNDPLRFVRHAAGLLSQNGILLISTPNKKITSPFTERPLNPNHFQEFTDAELYPLLSAHFAKVQRWGQRFVSRYLCTWAARRLIRLLEKLARKEFGIHTVLPSPEVTPYRTDMEPRILVYACYKDYDAMER